MTRYTGFQDTLFFNAGELTAPVDILKEALFAFQLERNSFTAAPYELTLVAASDSVGADIYASMDWEEISR